MAKQKKAPEITARVLPNAPGWGYVGPPHWGRISHPGGEVVISRVTSAEIERMTGTAREYFVQLPPAAPEES